MNEAEKRANNDKDIDELEKGTKENTLTMILFPKWKKEEWRSWTKRIIKRNSQMLGTTNNKRIAEKLRDPEAYYRKWNKKTTC